MRYQIACVICSLRMGQFVQLLCYPCTPHVGFETETLTRGRYVCAVPGLDCAVRKRESSERLVLCTTCLYMAVSFLFCFLYLFYFLFYYFLLVIQRDETRSFSCSSTKKNKIEKEINSEQLCSVVFRSIAFSRSANTTNRFEAAIFRL